MTADSTELSAVARLLKVAQRESGQSQRVADFLLAWYNAGQNGGWDPADLWAVDPEIADDIVSVIGLIRRVDCKYPNDLGFEQEIWAIWRRWRGAAESADE